MSVPSSLPPPSPSWFEFLPPGISLAHRARDETRSEGRGRLSLPCCSKPRRPGAWSGVRGEEEPAGGTWLSRVFEDSPSPLENPAERRTASPQQAFGVPLPGRRRMVVAPTARCRAALSLWIVSSFLCRAWTAPSTSRK